jgi:hypothetical protein
MERTEPVEEKHEQEPSPSTEDEANREEDANLPAITEGLVAEEAAVDYRSRWDTIQAEFVDEPQRSVEEADNLVSEVIEEVARTFQAQRSDLESQWAGEGVSTENLRVALQRYRSFFERLLTT